MLNRIKSAIKRLVRFLSYDIWRLDETVAGMRLWLYNVIKTFILTCRNVNPYQLNTRAAALTYNTLLSIVPMLAVLFAIAGGFGFENIVKSELFGYFEGQREALEKAMQFVDKSLEYASGGVFLGIGLVMLLYTVVSLMSNIEAGFNAIWRVKEGRSYYRQFTDYIAFILISPLFLLCNAGLSVFLNSSLEIEYIGIFMSPLVKLVPYALTILLFTIFYMFIPNTKVKLRSALFGALFAGIAFQVFQNVYISGQIWISKYNAIYGSFAILPLLLLWLQLSWFICLLGVELSFANQNIGKFSFEKEVNTISRRYKDFLILLITSLIIKRFEKGENPYTADELSSNYKIPTQLTGDILFLLNQAGIIAKTPAKEQGLQAYIPALDINKITVNFLFGKIDVFGSEDFLIDKDLQFQKEWNTIKNLRKLNNAREVLVKDL
ncbi:MAG: YihY/virulence factor BrkB family protein [Prevotella sp.]|jgi:membrane protein|nr:YihY/virulence factor BrkB family protein [Prevotella sp.]